MGRLIEADAFSVFLKDAVIRQKYDRLNIDNMLTVADVLQAVCAELDGTGLEGFKNAPTVDAAPIRHGRWINGKCDKCGGHAPFWSMATTYYPSKFCPHCGARMDGKDGDNHD